MIISHKHKFIFVKTHKTSTQTFLKFIKPHLGPDGVMAGDNGRGGVNENTVVNVDKVFPASGKCAADLQDIYGNHIPWFMIRDVVGQDMWDEYTTFTIERSPLDRFLSIFYFLHPTICKNHIAVSKTKLKQQQKIWHQLNETKRGIRDKKSDEYKQAEQKLSEFKDELKDFRASSMLEMNPEGVREYFEEWMLVQLLTEPEDIMSYDAYGIDSHEAIIKKTNQTANKLNLKKYKKLWKLNPTGEQPVLEKRTKECNCPFERYIKSSDQNLKFPYGNNQDVELPPSYTTWQSVGDHGKIYRPITGQARFLNYGYYYDGKNVTVDHIVDFKNVGKNMGTFFKKYNIDIKCDTDTYNKATQNAHFRLNNKKKGNKRPVDWWYSGKRGKKILNIINKQYNFIDKLI